MAQVQQFKWSIARAALALVLVASNVAAQTSAPAGPPRKISIALAGGQLTMFAPLLAAMGTKAFEKRGITIDPQSFGSGVAAFAAFAGGSTEFGLVGANQILVAGASGRDFVGIFNMYHGGAVVFVGAKKFQDRGTDLKKYDGANWAYTGEGAVSQVFMARAAQAAGLIWEKQGRLAVGGVEAFIPSLQSGRADLVTMDMKSAAQSIKLGIGYPVLNTLDPVVVEPIWGRQLGLPLATTRAFAARNPKLMQDMSDAMREALLAIQANVNDPAAILRMMPADFQEANRGDFAEQWALAKMAYMQTDGTFSDKAIADTVTFAKVTGVLKVPDQVTFDPNRYFDNTWAKQSLINVPARR